MSGDSITIKDVIRVKKELIDIIELEVELLKIRDLHGVSLLQSRQFELIKALGIQKVLFKKKENVDLNHGPEDLEELKDLTNKFNVLSESKKNELDRVYFIQDKIQNLMKRAAKNALLNKFYGKGGIRFLSKSASLSLVINKNI